MAHSLSAKKRARQNEKRRIDNKAVKSAVKTHVKKVRKLALEGKHEEAAKALIVAYRSLDKAAGAGVMHRNTSSRMKSRLTLTVTKEHARKAPAAPPAK
jgi:small subunit ribosomal protein S20